MYLFNFRLYSLRKSRHILHETHRTYKKEKSDLSVSQKKEFEETFRSLETAIKDKNRKEATVLAKKLDLLAKETFKKSALRHAQDFVLAIGFALFVAVIVRLMWFEPYEIPTGSMRPTLREQDRLIVSKTTFGINIPLSTGHFYFEPSLVERNGIFVFTGENMNIPDVNTLYFYLFPGKKQYIKRLIGKPGDALYFYGGKIYGIDESGNDISDQLQLEKLDLIEHIPFIHFERKVSTPEKPTNGIFSPAVIYQMDEPIAKLTVAAGGRVDGEMTLLPQIHTQGAPQAKEYGKLWGINNFAMARILSKDEVTLYSDALVTDLASGVRYLELRHQPNFAHAKLARDEWGRLRPMLGIETSLIPLEETHLRKIFDNLYTARFCIESGFAYRHGSTIKNRNFHPYFADVPDGCYEFYNGILYAVKWQGILEELPKDHPLYTYTAERAALLFNLGIEFDTRFLPHVRSQLYVPSRYSYFRDGDLYLLGASIFDKQDPTLVAFVEQEKGKALGFIDEGAPLNADGSLNSEKIRQYGLLIPEKSYLALGDNHAMSSDSRDFGFVPEDNMRGAPTFILWPPGKRWGIPNQPPYPFLNTPCIIIWCAATICLSIGYWRYRRRSKLPLDL